MPADGWRLASISPDAGQVWVRVAYPHDPVVKLRFEPDHYRLIVIESFYLVPRAPKGPFGNIGSGGGPRWWGAHSMRPEELEAWYREHLGYLGWREAEVNAYWRERPLREYPPILHSDLVRKEYEALRFTFTIEEGRTIYRVDPQAQVVPPGGWPPPEAQDERWPLCDETRGGEVNVAGEAHRLHESLCVSLSEPGRLRIQVAYGSSFVELDPETGSRITESNAGFEELLAQHLAPFRPRPPVPWPPTAPSPAL